MSMISAQIDELRELAGDGSMEWLAGPVRAIVLRDAADTIWELRCRLVDAEGRVRKSGELCKLCEREAENDELRKELAAWKRLTANIELPEYPMTQFQPKDLERENAKLREFATETWELLTCNEPIFVWSGLQEKARELGVESE